MNIQHVVFCSVVAGTVLVAAMPAMAATASVDIKRWPNGIVPYEVARGDASAEHLLAINDAIAEWNAKTVVRFVERKPGEEAIYPDYIKIVADSAFCGTYANGWKQGVQNVSIGDSCTLRHQQKSGAAAKRGAIHELGHALGLEHEQERYDAATYISLNKCLANEDIRTGDPATGKCGLTPLGGIGAQYLPGEHTRGWTFGAYDYFSVMQYHLWEGSIDRIDPATGYYYEMFFVPEEKRSELIFNRYNSPGLDINTYEQFRVAMNSRSGLTSQDIEFVNKLYSKSADLRVGFKTVKPYCSYKNFNAGKCEHGGAVRLSANVSNEGAFPANQAALMISLPAAMDVRNVSFDQQDKCTLDAVKKSVLCQVGDMKVYDVFSVVIDAQHADDSKNEYRLSAQAATTDHFITDNQAAQQYGGSLGFFGVAGLMGLLSLKRRRARVASPIRVSVLYQP